jgi:hypothetical protein
MGIVGQAPYEATRNTTGATADASTQGHSREVDPKQGSGCRPVTHPRIITVPAVALATHARDEAVTRESRPVGSAGVRAAAIGVVHETDCGTARSEAQLQRAKGQGSAVRLAYGPSHHLARVEVQEDRQVQPSFGGPDGRHLGDPSPVDFRCFDFARHHILSNWVRVLGVGRSAKSSLSTRLEPIFSHEPLYSLLTYSDALGSQLGMDTGAAVGAAAALVDVGNLGGQQRIGSNTRRLRPVVPCMKTTARDTQHATQHGNRVERLLAADKANFTCSPSRRTPPLLFSISRSISKR